MGKRWTEINLEIIEHDNSNGRRLEIVQGHEKYFVKDCSLTPQLEAIVDTAIKYGLNCLIRENHPQLLNRLSGVEYLGFSSCRVGGVSRAAIWDFCIDRKSPKPNKTLTPIKQVTFEKRHAKNIKAASINLDPEKARGKNVFVSIEDLEEALIAIGYSHA